jgi:hypothetical protein
MANIVDTNKMPKIKIVMGDMGKSENSGIYIDGVKIPCTYNVEFSAPVDELPTVRVDMWGYNVEVECDDANITLGVNEIRQLAMQEVTPHGQGWRHYHAPDEDTINRIVETVIERIQRATRERR